MTWHLTKCGCGTWLCILDSLAHHLAIPAKRLCGRHDDYLRAERRA